MGKEEPKQVQENPLATEKISSLIRRFSIPAIISLLVNAIYNIVDQIFIGHGIGTLGIAATNVAFPLTTICTAIALLLGVGGAANFNLSMGAGDDEKAANMAGNSLASLVVSGTAIAIIVLLLLDPLLYGFGATADVMEYAHSYTLIVAFGIPFMIFSTGASSLIRADGSPGAAMFCMLAGAIFNVIFDPIFMYTFDMGIAGIALATTLGQILSAGITLFYLVKKFNTVALMKRHFRIRFKYIKKICALGMASCFNQLAMTVVQITLNNTLRHYGGLSIYGSEIPLAAVGVISKINVIFMAFTVGTAQGCQPIHGFNYGAGNYGRVKQTYKLAITITTIAATIAFIVFQCFPRQVISIFGSGTDEYFQFATRYLRIYMFMTFTNGIQPVTHNFFTSIGKAKTGMLVSLTRQVIFLLPLILILPIFFGIDGLMFAGPIADTAAALVAIFLVVREMRRIDELQALEGGAT